MTKNFDGVRALITGGSSGIGLAVAKELARRGAHIALLARSADRLALAEAQVRPLLRPSRTLVTFSVDVSDEAAVSECREPILARLGGLDLLVHSAGATHPAAVHDTQSQVFRDLMDVNYFGTVYVTRAFLDHFKARRSGHIVGISSVAGLVGVYGYSAYTASKFAVAGFFECLRQELQAEGVAVSVVFPGDTNTPQLEAENRIKPAATRAVSGNVPPLEPEAVATALLEGVLSGEFHIVPGRHAKFVALMARHAPGVVRFVGDRQVRRTLTGR